MVYPQAYNPITSIERVKTQTEESNGKSNQRVILEIGQAPMFFTYEGPWYNKIENLQLCQGAESLRKNMPQRIDWRRESLDPKKQKEYADFVKDVREQEGNEEADLNDMFLGYPADPRFIGYKFDLNKNGLIVTYFDVAYEGVRGDKTNYIVGDNVFPAKDLNEAIRISQRDFTNLDRIFVREGRDINPITIPRLGPNRTLIGDKETVKSE